MAKSVHKVIGQPVVPAWESLSAFRAGSSRRLGRHAFQLLTVFAGAHAPHQPSPFHHAQPPLHGHHITLALHTSDTSRIHTLSPSTHIPANMALKRINKVSRRCDACPTAAPSLVD